MAPSAVSPAQQHAQPVKAGKDVQVVQAVTNDNTAPGSLTKPLADLMGSWETFSFAPIRESTVSRAMTRRCRPTSFPSKRHSPLPLQKSPPPNSLKTSRTSTPTPKPTSS